jgi:hypothetical protein
VAEWGDHQVQPAREEACRVEDQEACQMDVRQQEAQDEW